MLGIVHDTFKHLSHHQLPEEDHFVEDEEKQQLGHDQISCVASIGYIEFQILNTMEDGELGLCNEECVET